MKRIIDFSNLKGDLFGGLTAGIVALPLALAFGIQAFGVVPGKEAVLIGALAGITGAMFLGFFASLFGGTPSQISGPTGPMTVVTATVVAMGYEKFGAIEPALALIIMSFVFCGVFQLIFGFIKLGKYIRYIPYPVLSGFMTGIGVIIILLQIFPLAGQKAPSRVTQVISDLPELFMSFNASAISIGLATIVLIYVIPLFTKRIPATLLALIIMTVVSYFIGFDPDLTIGKIPSAFPFLHFSSLKHINLEILNMALIPGLTLAGLGTIDTLLTSVASDNITKTKHNSNKELIGQGIGNLIAGVFGGIPGAGATMRTIVNVRSGGRTNLSGIIHSIFLLLILVGLGRFVAYIPLSVLSGVLITVGIGIIDTKGLKDLIHIPRSDAYVLVTVLLLTVFVDLLQAVGIGMVIASVLFMKRASDLVEGGMKSQAIQAFDKEIPWEDEKDLNQNMLEKIYIQRLDGPIFFGTVTHFLEVMTAIPESTEIVIFRMRRVPYLDQSGLYAFETVIKELTEKGKIILITMLQPQLHYMMKKIDLIPDVVSEDHLFQSFEDCSNWLKEHYNVS